MNIILILAVSLSFTIHAQVATWGDGIINGTVQRIENGLGFGFACNSADRAESDFVDDCVQTYTYPNREQREDFDHMTEELIFMEATRRTHQLSVCQGRFHEGYASNPTVSTTLKQNAWIQFQDVRSKISQLVAEQNQAQAELNTWTQNYSYAEDRNNIPLNEWRAPRLQAAQQKLAAAKDKVRAMVARIPMGNRPEMRELYLELVASNNPIQESNFNQRFDGVMERMRGQVRESNAFFRNIITPSADRKGTIYNVNNNLKLNLVQNGQIDNVVRSLGMEDRLARGFVCRTRARYKDGPFARQMLEIPLYLAGGYGLGRLALRAGAWAVEATSVAGQLAARGAQMAAWAASVGLEGIQFAQDVQNACMVPEYLVGSLDTECTAESETQGVYQEASMAQCATAITLGLARPAAFVGGVVVSRVARAERVLSEAPVDEVEDIVVTARRREPEPESTPRPRVVTPPSRFSPAAAAKLEQTESNILGQNLPYDRGGVSAIVEHVGDDLALKKGFLAAYSRVQDKEVVAAYMRKLQEDTFDRMLASGNPNLVRMAQAGELDGPTMELVLRARVEARGARVVVIPENAGELPSAVFNQRLSEGFIIDYAGNKINPDHGAFGHLIQQDLTYDVIASESGKSLPEIMAFLGTENGGKVWSEMFDATGPGRGTVQVEQFNLRFMNGNIPLH